MEHYTVNNLKVIENEVQLKNSNAQIVAVSKTFPIKTFLPLVEYGHKHFGENKVQEVLEKWPDIKLKYNYINLHLIGKLQTNKVKFILPLVDYIHSLDNLKLAEKISEEQKKKDFKPKIFIQINIENEKQKSGISINNSDDFIKICKNKLNLDIIGIMCIPPNDGKHKHYFKIMKSLKDKFKLSELSMGMSNDYLDALDSGSSFIRVGSKIFGQRS
jgi:pyridoxal phosphate enzyme (YggS family)